jgi:2-C-methyl-D-erythritol 4-phosphate cytidylyltransferase/2-C-methyl-D-erythritol 2,4-cyclodiphosphate synthase
VTTAVVIVAGGSGTRLGSKSPKAFVSVAGRSVLERAVDTVAGWPHTHCLIVVVPAGWEKPAADLVGGSHTTAIIVTGGDTRTESVRCGLAALPEGTTRVLIHDAARALMPTSVFDRVLDALNGGAPAVVPELPVVDTLITIDRATHITGDSVDRDALAAVQTPQGFHSAALIAAYQEAAGDFTDDAAVMRAAGHEVIAVRGDGDGFKITYPADLHRAEQLLSPSAAQRVGTAMDVHQFDASVPLWLAGLEWPGEPGLKGHSDGDVVIHAIVDALLQAARLGDIGSHFGSDRPEFAGASSRVFLEHALTLVKGAGYAVSSVGVQVIANAPKLGPRRQEAEELLSSLVGAPVALGATTSDGLGFTGRGEGAAAIATAVLHAL